MKSVNRSAWSIDSEGLSQVIDSVVLVDVREIEEWEESRIEGAVHIPLGEIPMRAPEELNKEKDIVLYCAHGKRSMEALFILRSAGFEKVRSLEGGISAWEMSGFTNKS